MALGRGSSDVEALSRSFRSRVLLLGLLVVGGIAAATWSGTRDVGRGAPEEPRRVMVVTAGESLDYEPLLSRAGFVVEIDSFADWEAGALEVLAEDAQELSKTALLLELADERGFGFVVFEQPATLDFEGLEIEPPLAEIEALDQRDYLVLSVGDLGFPHRASVDDIGDDPLLEMPGHGALQALFAQPRLAPDREALERPTVFELQLEDAIRRGRAMVERPRGFADMVEQLGKEPLAELAEDRAQVLGGAFETGSALPLPDGGVLLLRHDLRVLSRDAETLVVSVDPEATMRLDYLAPEQVAGAELDGGQRCTSLAGGEIELAEQPSFESARDGSSIAITTRSGGTRLWRALAEPGCRWTALAELEPVDVDELGFGELAPRLSGGEDLLLARVADDGERAKLRLWTRTSTGEVAMHELLALAGLSFVEHAFLDGQHLALLARTSSADPEAVEHALHVVDRRRPNVHLRVPAEFIAPGRSLRELLAMPAAPLGEGQPASVNLHVLLTAITHDSRVEILELSVSPDAALELSERFTDASASASEAEPLLLTLSPDQLIVREHAELDELRGWALAPGGDALALVVVDREALDSELAWMSLAAGELELLTDNSVRDFLPRFAGDGRTIVFASVAKLRIADTRYTIPRVARIE